MTQREFKDTFDIIQKENIIQVMNETYYTITDNQIIWRQQEGLNKYHYWPLHVSDVRVRLPELKDLLDIIDP